MAWIGVPHNAPKTSAKPTGFANATHSHIDMIGLTNPAFAATWRV
jgi:hypothetical protein